MLDLVVYSHVAQLVMIVKDYPCPLRDYLEADCKNLVGLVNRMKDRSVIIDKFCKKKNLPEQILQILC